MRIRFKKLNEYHKVGETWTFGFNRKIYVVTKVYKFGKFGKFGIVVWKYTKNNVDLHNVVNF